MKKILAADLFCGAGGASTGFIRACELLGLDYELLAINHWQTAGHLNLVAGESVMSLSEFYQNQPIPKPEPRDRVKGRKDRAEERQKRKVRAHCVDRDGYCRLLTHQADVAEIVGACEGESQWAHLEEKKRFKTRNQEPEIRHTVEHSAMMCAGHHAAYDAGKFDIAPKTARGAEGLLIVSAGGRSVEV